MGLWEYWAVSCCLVWLKNLDVSEDFGRWLCFHHQVTYGCATCFAERIAWNQSLRRRLCYVHAVVVKNLCHYSKGRFTNSMPCPCRAHAVPLPCRASEGLECVFSIWFTQCGRVWFTLAMPRPCHSLTMPLLSRPRHGQSMAWARHGKWESV